jgi:predicted transcriptional regulator
LQICIDDKFLFKRLFKSTKEFISDLDSKYFERPYYIKTVNSDDTLEDVLNKLYTFKLHRIYITNESKKPIGLVGIKEILQEVLFS